MKREADEGAGPGCRHFIGERAARASARREARASLGVGDPAYPFPRGVARQRARARSLRGVCSTLYAGIRVKTVRVIRRSIFVAASASVMLGAPSTAQQREEILSYDVVVDVQPEGAFVVTEEITVRALGQEIRRGIYRDFPTRFPRPGGWGSIIAPFEVLSVSRGGEPEPHEVLSIGGPAGRGGLRVRIGSPNVFLPSGVHRYELVYRTERWMIYEDDVDRLYWNVTGNGWGFPMESVSARVILPGSVRQGCPRARRLDRARGLHRVRPRRARRPRERSGRLRGLPAARAEGRTDHPCLVPQGRGPSADVRAAS